MGRKKKAPTEVCQTKRLPTVEECDVCKYQNECKDGKYCVKNPQPVENKSKKKYVINIAN